MIEEKTGSLSIKSNTKNKLMDQYSSDVSDVVGKLTNENKSILLISQKHPFIFSNVIRGNLQTRIQLKNVSKT